MCIGWLINLSDSTKMHGATIRFICLPEFLLYFLIEISNIILNDRGAIACPCTQPLLNSNSEDKCLSVLTVASISLFIILHNLTNFFRRNISHFTPYFLSPQSGIRCFKTNKYVMYIYILFPTIFQCFLIDKI